MAKNIVIYSDGTGQFGGLKPDQRLSNIYKMYRASRIGSDSIIDSSEQVTFYDAGLGTDENDNSFIRNPITSIKKVLGSLLGIGISKNIIDCYEFILKHYECGDRIYLFGFSRGAYTVRCVANVMNLCGVPVEDERGDPISRYGIKLRAIATEAVKKVYEHGLSKPRGGDYEDEREEQARRFRVKYNCECMGEDKDLQGNVQPYFIGVFDTVAALGRSYVLIALGSILLSLVLSIVGIFFGFNFIEAWALASITLMALITIYVVATGYRSIDDYPTKGKTRRHIISWKLKNYDKYLDKEVTYARHALSIDEDRENFPRVGWGSSKDYQLNINQKPVWLKQVWFAGNHSDIGGSYPEDESRLSDISLQWMLEQIEEVKNPVIFDNKFLQTDPDSVGMQHSEIIALKECWPNWFPECLKFSWPKGTRYLSAGQQLHPSVLERFEADKVNHYGTMKPYRPERLHKHEKVEKYYSQK